jgi:hypothetical protein
MQLQLTALLCLLASTATATDFEREIAPLLVRRCVECHDKATASGGLVLSTALGLRTGGNSGAVFTPGQSDESLLLQRIGDGEMPPESRGQSQKLPGEEIELLRRWLKDGATWPEGRTLDLYEATSDVRAGRDFWSLQPLVRPDVPVVAESASAAKMHPIDAFIRDRLQQESMVSAPRADARTLIRRLYVDLIGLPPSFEEVETFAADPSETAWQVLIDKLLDSPQYGERWARYWLDVVRFAETCGYERDQVKPNAWKYRDWVINSFNTDMPFDEFIVKQLAGDELPDRTKNDVIATGFLMLGTWNDEPNDDADYQYDRLEDLVHATSSAFLGLTVKCARCHEHKFDPIPQLDYYRVASAFWAGPIAARDRRLIGGPSAEELGFDDVLGWTDLGREPRPLHVLRAGNRHAPMEETRPASLTAVPELFNEFDAPPDNAKTTHRRLQLARWIASEHNPLTARVFVNRLWQHHFGKGLVRSPNNFGFRGERPTHPELLDWLASEFVAGGWTSKRIHRLILTSDSWRQSSLHPQAETYSQRDASNQLWWRAERRRLDAEALRDSMLAASGEIDLRVGGSSFKPTIEPAALEALSRRSSAYEASPPDEQRRRSVYIFAKRHLLPPLLTTFDFADTTLPCGERNVTTVAPQALALLNNEFPHGRSIALARRAIAAATEAEAANALDSQLTAAWRFTLGREPAPVELQLAREHVQRQHRRFENFDPPEKPSRADVWRRADAEIVREGLVLHLRADSGVTAGKDETVSAWQDLSGAGHHATQSVAGQRPRLVKSAIGEHPALLFDGSRGFLHIAGSVLSDDECSIFAVATDVGPPGHREIISNWSGRDGNSGTSMFLGLTSENTVRFSDSFGSAGNIVDRRKPFLITAVNSPEHTVVFQSATELASLRTRLPQRRLDTPWVVGQQGNIDGEYWHGLIAEILVYDRAISAEERLKVWSCLLDRYQLPSFVDVPAEPDPETESPATLALASLCHVLLNSNEFIYVD